MARKRKVGLAKVGLAWEAAPLLVLAAAGVALLQDPRQARGRLEPGRGRFARNLREIPRRGWKDILIRTAREFSEDQVPLVSAGVTFYTLLALFPGLAAFVALYGLFANVAEAQHHLALLAYLLPPNTLQFLGDQMLRLADANKGGQSLTFIFSLLISLWSSNGAVKALMTGLNIAYEETERRSFLRRTLVSFAFTLGFLVFVLVGITLLAAGPTIEVFVGRHAAVVFGWISWPLLLVALTFGLALFYRFAPSRDPVRWRWLTWGSVTAAILWLVVSMLFSWYASNFGNYNKTYGSLGAVIAFMMWTWLSAVIVLMGGELNAEIEHQTAKDSTTGPPKPLGARGARMADTIGAPQD